MRKIVVHTEHSRTSGGDDLRGMIGRVQSRIRMLEGLAGLLRLLEALWYSADAETRRRAEKWTGWKNWLDAVRRAIDWA